MRTTTRRCVAKISLITVALLATTLHTVAQGKPVPPDLDAYVERAMKAFEVPGLSLAVVKDGKVVVAKGYGVRRLDESAPVDAQTRFGIGSNTKAFTGTALAILVDEKKLEWDAPVMRYLPAFQLADPYVTRELTVRDLLVHRSGLGLGAGDLLWWPDSTYTRPEIARRLRFIPLKTSFRNTYAYDNVLYLVAGELIEAVTGQSWEDFVTARILKKVGMNTSNVRLSEAAPRGNVAATHAPVEGKVQVVKPFLSDNVNPAGGVNSNAEDMAKWLLVHLRAGELSDGTRLFSAAQARQLTTPVTPTPTNEPPPELAAFRANFSGYALGFGVRDYRGRKMVSHGGGLPGYVSQVEMIPEAQLGVSVLTNQENGTAIGAITRWIADYYLDVPPTDWLAVFLKMRERSRATNAQAAQQGEAKPDTSSKPSLPLEKYAATYQDAWYGDITIAFEEGKLVIRFSHTPALIGDLNHWQYDTFLIRWRDRELRADAYITFALNPDGTIDQAKIVPASREVDFSFDFQDLLLRPVKRATN